MPIVVLAMALCAGGACADEPDTPVLVFRGFGTLGVVHSSQDRADFTSSTQKPHGAGYSRSWSAEVDSLIAGQVNFNPAPGLSAVLQVISEQNYDNTYTPHVEWANLSYEFTPDLSVRLGRTVLSAFMVADSRKVGYANPWVRPPAEVYRLVPVTYSDGIDGTYDMPAGDATATFQLAAGQSDSRYPARVGASGVTAEARDLLNVVASIERGHASARASAGRARLTIPEIDGFLDEFRKFGPAGVAIAEKYAINDRAITFQAIGASYDPGSWFVTGEWGRIAAPPLIGTKSGWYLGGGHRFGRFTTYATYAQAKADNLSDPGLPMATLPPALAGPAGGLNGALNAILSAKIVQKTISVGGRWDFAKNAALKLQYDNTRIGAGSTGDLANIQSGFQPGGKFDLLSLTLDFIF